MKLKDIFFPIETEKGSYRIENVRLDKRRAEAAGVLRIVDFKGRSGGADGDKRLVSLANQQICGKLFIVPRFTRQPLQPSLERGETCHWDGRMHPCIQRA